MNKILNIYKFLLNGLIFILLLLVIISINLKIRIDRDSFINKHVLDIENEFKQANGNKFVKLKNDLLDMDIVLDNISIDSESNIKFDIQKVCIYQS